MGGYCATGSWKSATPPSSIVTNAMTFARTGRSMKNLASTGGCSEAFPSPGAKGRGEGAPTALAQAVGPPEPGSRTGVRAFRSIHRCRMTKSDGTNRTARQVDASMPRRDRDAERPARRGAGAAREDQRQHAQDERERRHQDRPEAHLRRVDRGLEDVLAGGAPLARHLDDEDRVLGRQRDQQHEADLHVDVVREPHGEQRGDRSEQRHRHREDHGGRRDPALVLSGEHEVDEQDREGEDEVDGAADELLLVGHRRPLEAHAARAACFFARASIASSAWPELNPRAGVPLIVAAGSRL